MSLVTAVATYSNQADSRRYWPVLHCNRLMTFAPDRTAENHGLALAGRIAAMQHCGMATTTLPLTKRGSLTLPPALRRKMGLDKLRNPMVVVEERDGGLFLQTAVAMPVRDLPKGTIEQWIARDEAEMAAFRATPRKAKR
ncbi:MAG: hypothetical protein NTV51_04595 [Verrucomicrobia bacterium]|nr:hypothetical protein [Verrucomicrobiota bacterium]